MRDITLPGTSDLRTDKDTATQILRLAGLYDKTIQETLEDILEECRRIGVLDLLTSERIEELCMEDEYEDFILNRERDIEEILEDKAEREYAEETLRRLHKERDERYRKAIDMYERRKSGKPITDEEEGMVNPFFTSK